jgi:quercetin dioxygenase-like cupin family protein
MSGRKVELASAPQEPEAPGIAGHHADVGGTRWALVTYEPGVLREEYCLEPHSGYVVRGSIAYEFEDGGERLALEAGDAFALAPDGGHRGRAGAEGVTLFLIDAEVGHGR